MRTASHGKIEGSCKNHEGFASQGYLFKVDLFCLKRRVIMPVYRHQLLLIFLFNLLAVSIIFLFVSSWLFHPSDDSINTDIFRGCLIGYLFLRKEQNHKALGPQTPALITPQLVKG